MLRFFSILLVFSVLGFGIGLVFLHGGFERWTQVPSPRSPIITLVGVVEHEVFALTPDQGTIKGTISCTNYDTNTCWKSTSLLSAPQLRELRQSRILSCPDGHVAFFITTYPPQDRVQCILGETMYVDGGGTFMAVHTRSGEIWHWQVLHSAYDTSPSPTVFFVFGGMGGCIVYVLILLFTKLKGIGTLILPRCISKRK